MTEENTPEQQGMNLDSMTGGIMPMPLPTNFHLGHQVFKGDDGAAEQAVVLSLTTPGGINHYFISGEGAMQLGKALLSAGRNASAVSSVMGKPKLQIVENGKGIIKPS